ncbi:MAG: NAD-dependent deacylase [Pseudomonadota bacterium]
MSDGQKIVILTGAGLSAASGLGTFRDVGGIWSQYDLNDVATPDGFARNPSLVLDFYNARRENANGAAPNAGHLALARLEAEHSGAVHVVTQNVDGLHEAAGTQNLIHMHGDLARTLCNACGQRAPWDEPLTPMAVCPACGAQGTLRPNVVWFGEMPYAMDEIHTLLKRADLFVSIGTSGTVYPAAGFVSEAAAYGARTVELNLEPSEGASLFDEQVTGPADDVVPAFVERILNGG